MKDCIGKNAIILDPQKNYKILPFVLVSHTVPFVDQPTDIGQPVQLKPEPTPTVKGSWLESVQVLE